LYLIKHHLLIKMEKKTIINEAAVAALVFGIVAGAYTFVTYALSGMKGAAILTSLLWIVKTGGCIWLMILAMQRLCRKNPEADNSDTRLYGTFIALFSSILSAIFAYVAMEFVFTDATATTIDQVYQLYGQYADSNTMAMLDKMMDNYSMINFFSTLIWCFIYGSILSVILSTRIPTPDPFRNFKKEETTDEQ